MDLHGLQRHSIVYLGLAGLGLKLTFYVPMLIKRRAQEQNKYISIIVATVRWTECSKLL